MKARIRARVVDTDRNEWDIDGKSGIAYAILVRAEGESEALAATRVKVEAEQFGGFETGSAFIDLPVDVTAQVQERYGRSTPKLVVRLDPEFRPTKGTHRTPTPAGV